jgi:DNA-directed RNA polymerase specialized sigma24 family protein
MAFPLAHLAGRRTPAGRVERQAVEDDPQLADLAVGDREALRAWRVLDGNGSEQAADTGPGPAARYQARETVELAFITALQRLPSRQTAALLLCDVLGFATADVAAMLDTSPTAVKGILQRARAGIDRDTAGHDAAPARRPNGTWPAASPGPSPRTTSTASSRC